MLEIKVPIARSTIRKHPQAGATMASVSFRPECRLTMQADGRVNLLVPKGCHITSVDNLSVEMWVTDPTDIDPKYLRKFLEDAGYTDVSIISEVPRQHFSHLPISPFQYSYTEDNVTCTCGYSGHVVSYRMDSYDYGYCPTWYKCPGCKEEVHLAYEEMSDQQLAFCARENKKV